MTKEAHTKKIIIVFTDLKIRAKVNVHPLCDLLWIFKQLVYKLIGIMSIYLFKMF
jgi:hypothetical protein